MLWIPQVWAATIHSVVAGGDWSKAETWVGGQVPGEDDSVVVNGVVVTSVKTIAGLTVSSGATLINPSYSSSLTINGNIINNGNILNEEKSFFYIKVDGIAIPD